MGGQRRSTSAARWLAGCYTDSTPNDVPGIKVGDVNFINDRGEIAATGVLPNGDHHAILLVPGN
jgi:hypothetical protein